MSGWVIQRGPRSYAAVVYLGKDPGTGKKRYKWTSGFPTHRDAEAQLTTIASHPALGPGVGPFGTTRLRLGDYLQQWLRSLQLSDTERKNREIKIRKHIVPALGHLPIAKLHPMTLEEFFTRRREQGCNPTMDHHLFKILRAALNRAVRLGLISNNPCKHITAPQPRKFTPLLWTHEEAHRFLQEAEKTPYYEAFLTAMGTGLREGELFGLRWRDLDLEHGVAIVTQTLERPKGGGFRFKEFPKTHHSRRTVRLPEIVVEALRHLHRRVIEDRLRFGTAYHDLDLVLCQANGLPLHPRNIQQRSMRAICRRARVPVIRFHDLRHLHVTTLLQAGINPKVVQERLGHSAVSFLLKTYSHVLPDMQAEAAKAASTLLIPREGLAGGEIGQQPLQARGLH